MTRKQFKDFAKSKGKEVENDTVSFSTEAEAADFAAEARRRGFQVWPGRTTSGGNNAWHVT